MSVSVLVALDTKCYQIPGRVIAEAAPQLNLMDLKALDLSARLATPAVPLQYAMAELVVGFKSQPQAWPFRLNSNQRIS